MTSITNNGNINVEILLMVLSPYSGQIEADYYFDKFLRVNLNRKSRKIEKYKSAGLSAFGSMSLWPSSHQLDKTKSDGEK